MLQLMKRYYNLSCQVKKTNSKYLDTEVFTNVYFICAEVNIQLAIFYKRGSFLWIGADKTSPLKSKWFGDTSRALNL